LTHLCIKKNAEALVVTSKKNGLEVNADETKYMVSSQHQNAGRSQSIKIDNNSFERVLRVHIFGNNLNESKFLSRRT
jgi:hypothetical protein